MLEMLWGVAVEKSSVMGKGWTVGKGLVPGASGEPSAPHHQPFDVRSGAAGREQPALMCGQPGACRGQPSSAIKPPQPQRRIEAPALPSSLSQAVAFGKGGMAPAFFSARKNQGFNSLIKSRRRRQISPGFTSL